MQYSLIDLEYYKISLNLKYFYNKIDMSRIHLEVFNIVYVLITYVLCTYVFIHALFLQIVVTFVKKNKAQKH